ncbi:MAG: HipA N-terminal domain-containing protein [Oscillospiraceae bacterium]
MMAVYRTAHVYVRNAFAGELCETDEGYCFTYDEDYLRQSSPCAVSLTMPLQAEPYASKIIFPFFDGLIPEGWLLDVVSRNWKLDRSDRFGLLLVACRDSIGSVSIREVCV